MPYWIWFLLIGLVAGWLAGQIMKGSGFGWLGDMVVGVIGASSADSSSTCSGCRRARSSANSSPPRSEPGCAPVPVAARQ